MRRVLILLVALVSLSCTSGDPARPLPTVPDDVVGLWTGMDVHGEVLRIAPASAGSGYVGTLLSGSDPCAVGRPSLEFHYQADQSHFVGRHLWCNSDTLYWGASDMVLIEQSDRWHLRVRFLDHVWTDGWRYQRLEE